MNGEYFEQLPNDIVGVTSDDNDQPLEHKDATGGTYDFSVVSKTENEIIFEGAYTGQYNWPQYLGAIVSADRQTVYWVNETRPIQ